MASNVGPVGVVRGADRASWVTVLPENAGNQ